ncbi:MAG: Crp/Fnr family transcriptional regulator [Deltaproteobacteria bacterium]|nr:Crp/Fnr family transcriptional regulator [Deltaproteobacteria bacterium]
MSRPEDVASIPLFEGLPGDEVEQLSAIAADRSFRRGESIFLEGDEGDGFYVVLSGRVKVFKLSMEGKEQTLHLFGPGEPFGEVALFAGRRFPANAEALEESRILFFPREAFAGLIRQNPSVAMNLLALLSVRLRRFTALIEDLSLKEVPGRLSAYLLYLSRQRQGGTDLALDVTKAQLASLLGTIPETLSRILGRMSRQGLIESDGRRIRILDLEGLESLAEGGGF